GLARLRTKEWKAAIADFTEAIRLDPKSLTGYGSRGIARSELGDLDGAIADFTEAIRLDPKKTDAYSNRGEYNFAKGQYQSALSDFQKALKLDKSYKYALAGMAVTQNILGNKKEAQKLWRSLIAQNSSYRDADWVGSELNWHPAMIQQARN